jgi:hypothetical protein
MSVSDMTYDTFAMYTNQAIVHMPIILIQLHHVHVQSPLSVAGCQLLIEREPELRQHQISN